MQITPRTATLRLLGKRLSDMKSISQLIHFHEEWLEQGKGRLETPTEMGKMLKMFIETLVILLQSFKS